MKDEMKIYLLLMTACLAFCSSCKNVHINCSNKVDNSNLNENEIFHMKQQLVNYWRELKQKTGEDLIIAFADQPYGNREVEKIMFNAYKNYLIEQELTTRGAQKL